MSNNFYEDTSNKFYGAMHRHWDRYIDPLNAVSAALTEPQKRFLNDAINGMGKRNFLNPEEIGDLKLVAFDLMKRGVINSYVRH